MRPEVALAMATSTEWCDRIVVHTGTQLLFAIFQVRPN